MVSNSRQVAWAGQVHAEDSSLTRSTAVIARHAEAVVGQAEDVALVAVDVELVLDLAHDLL